MDNNLEILEVGCLLTISVFNLVLYLQIKKSYHLTLSAIGLCAVVDHGMLEFGSIFFRELDAAVLHHLSVKGRVICCLAISYFLVLHFQRFYSLHGFDQPLKYCSFGAVLLLLVAIAVPFRVLNDHHLLLGIKGVLFLVSTVAILIMLLRAINLQKPVAVFTFVALCILFVFALVGFLIEMHDFSLGSSRNLSLLGIVLFLFFQSSALISVIVQSSRAYQAHTFALEQSIEEKDRQLKRSNLLRETLIRIIGHDVRGSLSNIKSIARLTLSGDMELEVAKGFFKQLDVGVDQSLQMLEGMQQWGRATSMEPRVRKDPTNITQVINDALDVERVNAEKKDISIQLKKEADYEAAFDENVLSVICRNLVNNAVKFTPRGGQVEVSIMKCKDQLSFSIADSGIGVPDKMKEDIFEMKKDHRRLGTENEKSSGVGLFICKDLVEQNGGQLWVEDNESGGAIFYFNMPIVI